MPRPRKLTQKPQPQEPDAHSPAETKTSLPQHLLTKVKAVLKANPKATTLLVCTDGMCFLPHKKAYAKHHAATLPNTHLYTYTQHD